MKLTKNVYQVTQEIVGIFCDVCLKEYSSWEEINGFYSIDFVAGFASIFGDGSRVTCDICQHCLKEILGAYLKIKDEHKSI